MLVSYILTGLAYFSLTNKNFFSKSLFLYEYDYIPTHSTSPIASKLVLIRLLTGQGSESVTLPTD